MVGVKLLPGFLGLTDENVMVGAVISYVTVLSDDVDAELLLPNVSTTVLAAMVGIIEPDPVTAVAANVQIILSLVESDHVIPVAEPF
jgi:uncharacterized membrane protein